MSSVVRAEGRRPAVCNDAAVALGPQLWCPGVAFVTPAGDIELGPSVGYSSRDASFRRQPCGQRRRLAYWTHVVWLVTREALDDDIIADQGIILPETLIDRAALPHAQRWLREQPLLCVSGATWSRLAGDGVRTFRIAFDATGDDRLHAEAVGGASALTSLTVSLQALNHAVDIASGGVSLVDFGGSRSPIDRVLRLLSGGALDESPL